MSQQYTIHVGNLPMSVTKDFLKTLFGEFGQIVKITLCHKEQSQYAFIQYQSADQAQEAVNNTDYITIERRKIHVNLYRRDFTQVIKSDSNIVIRNIPEGVSESSLHDAFEVCGPIISCKLSTRDGKPNGVAYIQYENPKDAEEAISTLNGETIDGQQIEVAKASQIDFSFHLLVSDVPSTINNKDELQEWLIDILDQPNSSIEDDITQAILLKLPDDQQYRGGVFSFEDKETTKQVFNALIQRNIKVRPLSHQEKKKITQENIKKWDIYKQNQSIQKCVYVTNLLKNANENTLREIFSKWGEIANIVIKSNPKGTAAFITYTSNEGVPTAIQQSTLVFFKLPNKSYQQLRVDLYIPKQHSLFIDPLQKRRILTAKEYIAEAIGMNGSNPILSLRAGQMSDSQILALYDDNELLTQFLQFDDDNSDDDNDGDDDSDDNDGDDDDSDDNDGDDNDGDDDDDNN